MIMKVIRKMDMAKKWAIRKEESSFFLLHCGLYFGRCLRVLGQCYGRSPVCLQANFWYDDFGCY
jgi:hypothetical protein